MSNENETITGAEANYLKSCKSVVADLENHVKQCNQEFEHYTKMAEFAKTQVLISQDRLLHEQESLADYKKLIGVDKFDK